jgi:hypothetical protein
MVTVYLYDGKNALSLIETRCSLKYGKICSRIMCFTCRFAIDNEFGNSSCGCESIIAVASIMTYLSLT